MSKTDSSRAYPDAPPVYEIRLKGHLGEEWSDWFDGMTITLEDTDETLLTGPVVDQAALHGLLKKVVSAHKRWARLGRPKAGPSASANTDPSRH